MPRPRRDLARGRAGMGAYMLCLKFSALSATLCLVPLGLGNVGEKSFPGKETLAPLYSLRLAASVSQVSRGRVPGRLRRRQQFGYH